jgi:hypothetical protein
MGEGVVEPQVEPFADDFRFGKLEQRSQDLEGLSFDTRPGRERGEALEGDEVLWATVRIAGVIEGVDADDDGRRSYDLSPAESEGQEDRVPGWDVRRRNVAGAELAVLWDGAVADERGSAERCEVDVELEVPHDVERARNVARRLHLPRVHWPYRSVSA